MDAVLSILSTSLVVLNEAKAFAESVKQTEELRERLQIEVSSTSTMLDQLRGVVEDIGSFNAALSMSSQSGEIQSLLKLDSIRDEAKNLQRTVENVHTQLESMNARTYKEKLQERLNLIFRPLKRKDKVQALLNYLVSVRENASLLFQVISIRLQEAQRREQAQRENERKQAEAEKLRQEEERRRQEVDRQELEKSEKQRQELIDWLKPFDYNSKHQAATHLRQKGTCGWLLDDETFVNWRCGSGSKFLWLYGIPGSGKTILCSKVVDDLENLADTTVAYHYCDFMNAESIIPSTILRNIFVQLLRRSSRNWLDEFKDLSTAKKEGKSPPNGVQDLASYIQRACKFHQRAIIAIDALDECRANSERQKLLQLLSLSQMDNISFFVTSRDEHDFRSAFRDLPSLSTGDTNIGIESDIKTFISSELNERPRLLELPEGLRDQIMRTLAEKSKGLFHWVYCQIVAIEDCLTEEAIVVTLQSLPRDMNQTYERILKNILSRGPHAAEMARRILLWLVGATRPLHILELCEAIMIEPESTGLNEGYRMIDPMNILRACGSLIQSFSSSNFDGSSRARSLETILEQNLCDELFPKQDVFQNHRTTYIRLSHYTVKEFLQKAQLEDSRLAVYHLPLAVANHDIAILILTYLTQDVFDRLEISLWDSHGLTYSFYRRDDRESLSKFMGGFGVGMLFSYGWTNWESHLLHSTNSESLYGLVRQFVKKRLGQLRRDIPILRELDLTVDVDNKYIYVLLLFAMVKGIGWLIQHLLNDSPISDHLNRIMSMGKDKTNAVEVLIQAGASLNTLDMRDHRALFTAASRGYLELSWVLIQAGVDFDAVDKWGGTALHEAVYGGHLEVSMMLVQAGVDPNAVDKGGRTALREAVSQGHSEVSTMLIQAGANPNVIDRGGRSALHDAASRGDLAVSTMLIQAGADPNAVTRDGSTALHHATSRGLLEVSTMLIQAGVNPNAADRRGRSALHHAASEGRLEISKVLIQAGADPLSKNKSGKTPLQIAIDLHSKPIVECLLSNGAPLAGLGLMYDEQVQWAQGFPWYSQLTLREFDYSAPVDEEVDVIPSRSVLEVRWTLYKILRLPSEVASLILDLSEYWAHSFVWRKDQIVSYSDVSYLSVKLRSKRSGSLRKMVFTTKSHEVDPFSDPDKEPVYKRYYDSYFEVTVTPPTGKPSVERHLIQPNVSNSLISRIHVKTWEYKDHANWMDKIHPGDVISVHAIALLEKNVVDFVRMDIYCAW